MCGMRLTSSSDEREATAVRPPPPRAQRGAGGGGGGGGALWPRRGGGGRAPRARSAGRGGLGWGAVRLRNAGDGRTTPHSRPLPRHSLREWEEGRTCGTSEQFISQLSKRNGDASEDRVARRQEDLRDA